MFVVCSVFASLNLFMSLTKLWFGGGRIWKISSFISTLRDSLRVVSNLDRLGGILDT